MDTSPSSFILNLCIVQISQHQGVQPLYNIQQSDPQSRPKSLQQRINPTKRQLHPTQPAHLNYRSRAADVDKEYTSLVMFILKRIFILKFMI